MVERRRPWRRRVSTNPGVSAAGGRRFGGWGVGGVGEHGGLRLLSMVLSHAGAEACVCDLNDAVDLSQPTVSHHLKVLHDVGLLDREKRGVWVYDSARPEALSALAALLGATG